jgi:hypothetical protein
LCQLGTKNLAKGTPTLLRELVGTSLAKFFVPDLGDIVETGIGLSYRHAMQPMQPCEPARQPYARVDFIHQLGTMNLATDLRPKVLSFGTRLRARDVIWDSKTSSA